MSCEANCCPQSTVVIVQFNSTTALTNLLEIIVNVVSQMRVI